jgi:hypothetical protein
VVVAALPTELVGDNQYMVEVARVAGKSSSLLLLFTELVTRSLLIVFIGTIERLVSTMVVGGNAIGVD